MQQYKSREIRFEYSRNTPGKKKKWVVCCSHFSRAPFAKIIKKLIMRLTMCTIQILGIGIIKRGFLLLPTNIGLPFLI